VYPYSPLSLIHILLIMNFAGRVGEGGGLIAYCPPSPILSALQRHNTEHSKQISQKRFYLLYCSFPQPFVWTIHSCLFPRINPNKGLGLLNTWFSSPILLGFLLSPLPYSQSFPAFFFFFGFRFFFIFSTFYISVSIIFCLYVFRSLSVILSVFLSF
jgi:hypothetical protein